MQLMSEERVTSLDPVFGPMGIEAGKAIWSETALSMREKAILLITADLCVPELGLPFELHVGMALGAAHMPVEHLRELLRHIGPDAGMNIVAMGFAKLTEFVAEQGLPPVKRRPRARAARLSMTQLRSRRCASLIRPLPARWTASAASSGIAPVFRGGSAALRPSPSMWWAARSARRSPCMCGCVAMPVSLKSELHAALRALAEFSIPKAWQALIALHELWPDDTATNAEGDLS